MARVLLRSLAEAEVTEATLWYAARSLETARRFVSLVDATLTRIAADPSSFPMVGLRLRRAIVRHFPYAIYFIVLPDIVVVIGVIHTRRHPRRWQRRDSG